MNRRDSERSPGEGCVCEIHQPRSDGRFVQEFESLLPGRFCDPHARRLAEFVEISQPVLGEQLEDCLATATTKGLPSARRSCLAAGRSAVETPRRGFRLDALPGGGNLRRSGDRSINQFDHAPATTRRIIVASPAPGLPFFAIHYAFLA